ALDTYGRGNSRHKALDLNASSPQALALLADPVRIPSTSCSSGGNAGLGPMSLALAGGELTREVQHPSELLEALRWCLEAIAFPWSLVEFSRRLIAVALPRAGQRSSLAEVLAQQPIEVFVAAAFPWMMRIGEVAAHAGGGLDLPVAVELGAVVPGDRLEGQAAVLDQLDRRAVDGAHRAVRQPDHLSQAGAALDQRQEAGPFPAGAHDRVAFPVADFTALLDLRGPGIDHGLAAQLSPLLRAVGAFSAPLPAVAQEPEHGPAPALVPPHVPVDGHVAERDPEPVGQLAGDLLRAPLGLGQERLDVRVDLRAV